MLSPGNGSGNPSRHADERWARPDAREVTTFAGDSQQRFAASACLIRQ